MKINITARHFKAKVSTQKYVKQRLEELEKYNENVLHADVILFFDKPPADTKHCEIILKLKDKLLMTKASSTDFDRAIDLAYGKIEKQLYKFKDKVKTKKYQKKVRVK